MTTLFFLIAHVSRDGRDLVILTTTYRIVFIRDFERICRGETSLLDVGRVLGLLPGDECFRMAFEHGRVCVATVRVFPYTFHVSHTHASHPFLSSVPCFSFYSSSGFTSLTPKGTLQSTR